MLIPHCSPGNFSATRAYGATIRSLVMRRFGILMVDELQDTGFLLAKSIRTKRSTNSMGPSQPYSTSLRLAETPEIRSPITTHGDGIGI